MAGISFIRVAKAITSIWNIASNKVSIIQGRINSLFQTVMQFYQETEEI